MEQMKSICLTTEGYHDIEISPNNNFFTDKFSTANSLPVTYLYKITGEKLEDLIQPDMSFYREYGLSPLRFTQFTTTGWS